MVLGKYRNVNYNTHYRYISDYCERGRKSDLFRGKSDKKVDIAKTYEVFVMQAMCCFRLDTLAIMIGAIFTIVVNHMPVII